MATGLGGVWVALLSALSTALVGGGWLRWRGHLRHASGDGRDLASRRAREALLISEERLRQAVRVAGFGVFEHDHLSDVIYASPEFRRLNGLNPDEPVTVQRLIDNVDPEDLAQVQAANALAWDPAGDGLFEMRCRIHLGGGRMRWIESRAQTLFEGEGAARHKVRTIGAVNDVTERHEAEASIRRLNAGLEERVRERTAELEATVRELEAFSYTVSHDLRAPLRAIDGFSRALAEDHGHHLDETGRDFLRRVRKNTLRMSRLIDDLMKLGSVSRGTLSLRECDLAMLARSTLNRLREAQPGRQVDAVIEPALQADADLGLLVVVIDNLLGNAWKYTAPVVQGRISFGRVDTPQGPAFCVADNGIGFDMQQASRLFNPFQRLHGAQDFEGTGIGLATVQRIVARHGGKVWAESEPGQGARFYFTLAAVSAPAAAESPTVPG